jgi:hypothetical protein
VLDILGELYMLLAFLLLLLESSSVLVFWVWLQYVTGWWYTGWIFSFLYLDIYVFLQFWKLFCYYFFEHFLLLCVFSTSLSLSSLILSSVKSHSAIEAFHCILHSL